MTSPRRRVTRLTSLPSLLCSAVLLAAVVAGCGAEAPLVPPPATESTRGPLPVYDPGDDVPPARSALTLVPGDATEVAVTDFDEVRARLGVPDLTSDSLVSDRVDFWERARRQSVLLSEGSLREQDSRLMLDHGFTSDDVDWEARWRGPEGEGWVIGFRPDLDMARVQGAADAGITPLSGAEISADTHTASSGAVADSEASWSAREGVRTLLTDASVEAAYYRVGCVQLADALGPDADSDDLDRLLSRHQVDLFEELDAFSVVVADGQATARLGLERSDVTARADLADDAPRTGPVGWSDAFGEGVNDPATGRIGWDVRSPVAAAGLILGDELPFAACADVRPLEEPTGL